MLITITYTCWRAALGGSSGFVDEVFWRVHHLPERKTDSQDNFVLLYQNNLIRSLSVANNRQQIDEHTEEVTKHTQPQHFLEIEHFQKEFVTEIHSSVALY